MNCPDCGSDQWKSARLIHKEGISSSAFSSLGAGISTNGPVCGGASTTGVHQSELSKAAAPPASFRRTGGLLASTGITFFLGFVAWWWWCVTALCVFAVVPTYRAESREDDVASERYERTRVCTRCGMFYVAGKTS